MKPVKSWLHRMFSKDRISCQWHEMPWLVDHDYRDGLSQVANGIGLAFLLPKLPGLHGTPYPPASTARTMDQNAARRLLHPSLSNRGQALIEYALLLPLLFLLVVNAVNFGGFFYGWITMANAARAGADYAILGGASVGDLQPATAAEILSMIKQDVSSLPNSSTLTVSVCQNNNGTITALTGSCSAIPSDPEPTNYVLTTVDVTYNYKPFIPAGFQFPNLNIYVTIPPTTVHRRAVMRSIQ